MFEAPITIERKIQKAEAPSKPYRLRETLKVIKVNNIYKPIDKGKIANAGSDKKEARTLNALLLAKLSKGSSNHTPHAIKRRELNNSKKSV